MVRRQRVIVLKHRNIGLIIHGHKPDMDITPTTLVTYSDHAASGTDIRNNMTRSNDVLTSAVIKSECSTNRATAPDTKGALQNIVRNDYHTNPSQ